MTVKGWLRRLQLRFITGLVGFFSYVERLELVKSLLSSMQTFWCQIFLLPKKLIKAVEAACRNFLWNGKDAFSKAPVAWHKDCLPRTNGGLNVKRYVVQLF